MKRGKIGFVFLFFIHSFLFSQQRNQIGISGFYVQEIDSLPIGFSSVEYMYPLYKSEKYDFKGGLQFIGALTGVRGGYFAFGYRFELNSKFKKRVQFGSSFSMLAGGGGSAPDKDGWMLQGSVYSQFKLFTNLKLRAGLSYTEVSGSIIKGFSPTCGLYWNILDLQNDTLNSRNFLKLSSVYPEVGFAISKSKKLGFIGTGASWEFGKLAGDISVHALANVYGGYMHALLATGFGIGKNRIKLIPAVIIGAGGGGGTSVGGGALVGFQCGVKLKGETMSFGLKYQNLKAISGDFGYQGMFVSLGKSIHSSSKFRLKLQPVVKAYFGKEGFGNLGVRVVGLERKLLSLMGSTYWAFTNNKGAYAEGLFELTLKPTEYSLVYSILSIGAGAGAGINGSKGSVIGSVGLGLISPWKKLPISIELGLWKGGNIPSYSLSMIYQF